jgi:hypothetical protein
LLDLSQQPLNGPLFASLDRDRPSVEVRFLTPPINPARTPSLVLSAAYVALSNVNVTNPNNYAWADPEALRAVTAAEPKQSVGSVETTHGVIRLAVPSPQFLFVSGLPTEWDISTWRWHREYTHRILWHHTTQQFVLHG